MNDDMNDEAKTVAVALLRSIVEEDPLTHSSEGLDDGCFFCGADSQSRYNRDTNDFEHWAVHEHSCEWIIARHLFNIPLGFHRVTP